MTLALIDIGLVSFAFALMACAQLLTARKLTKSMARIENSHHQMGQKILNL